MTLAACSPDISTRLTGHARTRMAERGVSLSDVEIVLKHGRSLVVGDYQGRLMWRLSRRILRKFPHAMPLAPLRVVTGRDGMVITVMWSELDLADLGVGVVKDRPALIAIDMPPAESVPSDPDITPDVPTEAGPASWLDADAVILASDPASIAKTLRYARRIARRGDAAHLADEAESLALLSLLSAAGDYRPGANRWDRWLYRRIHRDFWRMRWRGCWLGRFSEAGGGPDLDEELAAVEDRRAEMGAERLAELTEFVATVRSVLGRLPARQAAVIRWRYGLEDGRERTQAETGKEMGIKQVTVSELEIKAMAKLRTILGAEKERAA